MLQRLIAPILVYVEMLLVTEQVARGHGLTIPMMYEGEAGKRTPVLWEMPAGRPKRVALKYLCDVLFCLSPRELNGVQGEDSSRPATTVRGYWQRMTPQPRKSLVPLTPYESLTTQRREQYVKDLISRCEDLGDYGSPFPYRRVAELIGKAVEDCIEHYLKSHDEPMPSDSRPMMPDGLSQKLEELSVAQGGYAMSSLRECVKELVNLGSEEAQRSASTPPSPKLPERLAKAEIGHVAKIVAQTLEEPKGGALGVVLTGPPGSGKRLIITEAIMSLTGRGENEFVFWNRYERSLRATISAAILGRNGNTDEKERFDQAVHALATLGERKGPRGIIIVALRDVEARALMNERPVLKLVADAGAVVVMSVTIENEAESLGREINGDLIVEKVLPVKTEALVSLGRAHASETSRGLYVLQEQDAKAIARRCEGNLGLTVLSCALVGRLGSANQILEALGEGDGSTVERTVRVLGIAMEDVSALAALELLPPEGVSSETARSLVQNNVPLLIELLDVGFLMRDRITGRVMLNGHIAEAVARHLAVEEIGKGGDVSMSTLGKAANRLWRDIKDVRSWSALEEAMACFERLIELLDGREAPWVTLSEARLARLYGKTGRTWLSTITHEDIIRRMNGALEAGEELHDPLGDLVALSCDDALSSVAEEYLLLGHAQMQYGRRGTADETFKRGISILGDAEPTRERRAVKARILREMGWNLHEEWKRGEGNYGHLRQAIRYKRDALAELEALPNPPAKGRELQSVLSTLGFSLIESTKQQEREEAVEYAREGLCKIYEDITGGDGSEVLSDPEEAQKRVKSCRAQFAEALYFYGRILAGGERPGETRIPGSETDEELVARLERALRYERVALDVREGLSTDRWNMTRALNLASMGMIQWALNRKRAARKLITEAIRIQDYRTHVTDEFGRETGKAREKGPITDWFYRIFPDKTRKSGTEP